jgi:hypothetical protein
MNWKQLSKPIMAILNMCDVIWPYQHTYCLSTSDDWCFSWILGWFRGLLHKWHPHFFKEHGGAQMSYTSSFGKHWEVKPYTKLEICEFYHLWSGIVGLHHFLEMAFIWILVRFRPLLIGLLQLLGRCKLQWFFFCVLMNFLQSILYSNVTNVL